MISEDQVKSILIDDFNVSRETMNDLMKLVELLSKWNKSINLIGKSTINDIWGRHILDSAQIWLEKPENIKTWVDLGSGGGFPALVLAILAKESFPDVVFHMIESDARKSAFLRNVSRETSLNTRAHTVRIENSDNIAADVISARALASTDTLMEYSQKFLTDNTICLFLKGRTCGTEVEKARVSWCFQSSIVNSISDDTGAILKVWNIKRA